MKKLGILFMVLAWQHALACNTEHLRVGPRLLKAQACFGTVMRVCAVELVALSKLLKPAKAMRVFTEYCRLVNACRDAAEKLTTKMVCECVVDQIRNTSATIYTLIDDPHAFVNRFNELLRCGRVNKILDSPWPVIADAYNVLYKAVRNFGWR